MLLPIAVLALSSEVAAWGQDHPNGYFLTSPASVSSGYDSDFPVASGRLSDSVTLLTSPTFAWLRSTHRTSFGLDYQADFEIFGRNEDLDSWNHAASMRFRHQINSVFSVDAGDSFLSTMDPTRSLVNSLLLLPRGRFDQNAFYTELRYRKSQQTLVIFRFDNAITTMSLPAGVVNRLDQVSNAGSVTVDRTLNRHHKLLGTLAFLHVNPLNSEVSGSATNAQLLTLGYLYTVSPDLRLRFSGGLVHGSQTAFTGSAAVEKRFGGMWLAAGYQRYLSFFGGLAPVGATPVGGIPFAQGLTPDSIYQVASLRAWGKLTRRVGMEVSAQRALSGVDQQDRGIKSMIGQLRLDYRLNERMVWFTRLEYYGQNINEFSQSALSRKRFFGGIEFALSHPPERADLPGRFGPASEDLTEPQTLEQRPSMEKE